MSDAGSLSQRLLYPHPRPPPLPAKCVNWREEGALLEVRMTIRRRDGALSGQICMGKDLETTIK